MSKAKKLTTKYRLEQWTSIIQERIKSGKRVDEWCSENSISRDAYYYWLRKVKLTDSELQLPKVVQLIPPAPVGEKHNAGTAIILRVNGISLEIQDCVSDSIIEKTLHALRNICQAIFLMRRSINCLASLVQSSLGLDPFSRKLFLFCGKHADRMKALLWEDDGLILLYKRLENGKLKWLVRKSRYGTSPGRSFAGSRKDYPLTRQRQ